MTVPVATAHNDDSRTHHRNGESSIALRIPYASGNIRVHGSETIAFSFDGILFVIGRDVDDADGADDDNDGDDDDDSSVDDFIDEVADSASLLHPGVLNDNEA
jgi:hypothetical protein